MSSDIVKLILFGPPGAGKGTIAAQLIRELPDGAYLATGDHFRKLIRENDPRTNEFSGYMEAGELIPDDLVLAEMKTLWSTGRFDSGFVFDGFPRTIGQAHALDQQLGLRELGSLTAVAYIVVPDGDVLRRLTTRRVCPSCDSIYNVATLKPKIDGICDRCGSQIIQRPDDVEGTILRRLSVYKSQTAEILSYYQQLGLLLELDGMSGVESVLAEIRATLA